MSRYNETEETCEKVTKNLLKFLDEYGEETSVEEIHAGQISGIINILVEIALSLGMIADTLEAENDT